MRPSTAAAAGLVALAAGAALARRRAARPAGTPDLPPPPEGRLRTVTTEDGVALHVEEFGAEQPVATVVLAHGYVQSSRLWAGQVRDLLEARPDLRVVTYDHRGHGRSGATTRDRATIEHLGRDMARVVEEVAPAGPVVVAGHSMGGMNSWRWPSSGPTCSGAASLGWPSSAPAAGAWTRSPTGCRRPWPAWSSGCCRCSTSARCGPSRRAGRAPSARWT
ncbi:alpha/beta fold hydrolase [Geodermatophilus saharensis]|uniref:alpha/beta hydrolase n=1 Tax=Geodermatophilus saharensis TaxID=1137994 RepID=UPI000B791A44